MFCPKCRSMLISSAGQLKCRKCGYIRPSKGDESLKITRTRSDRDVRIVEAEGVATMPTCTAKCPKCGNNQAFWWLRQLRSADESEVRFFRCTQCSHTWREYD